MGHWWDQILHNQSALRLKGRLLFQPGVMVTSVPWQLASAERAACARPETMSGASRRGHPVQGTTPQDLQEHLGVSGRAN